MIIIYNIIIGITIIIMINPVKHRGFTKPFGEAKGLNNIFVRKM
jgi:hypothetical protein